MIRLVHVAGSAALAGGGDRYLLDLLGRLDPRRFEGHVVCPERGPMAEDLRRKGIRAETVELSPLGSPLPLARLCGALRRAAPDIVQSHGARSNFLARLASSWLGLRHVSTVHNAIADYPVSWPRRALYSRLDSWSSRFSERVVCVAESLSRDLVAQGYRADRLAVIHNGVDLDRFRPERVEAGGLRREWGGGGPLVGVAGRMTDQKGHRYFLEALARLGSEASGVRAVFVGDGPLRGELVAQAARLGLGDRVRFAGMRGDMPEVLAALDLVVLPSVSEGLPYVLLEALAMRRACIASAVDGVLEVVRRDGDGALLVPPRDPEALAAAMRRIFRDPAAAQAMALRGREIVERDFSLAAMVRRWGELYEELCSPAYHSKSR